MAKHKRENEMRTELKKFMKKTGFTANFIGKEAECHPQTITNWLSGAKSIRVDTLERIQIFMETVEAINGKK